jgi:hypothetical protein
MRLMVILCFIGVCFTSNAQTIKYVNQQHLSDVNALVNKQQFNIKL